VDTKKEEDFSWQVVLDRLAPIETNCGRDVVSNHREYVCLPFLCLILSEARDNAKSFLTPESDTS
jgi:hypothetical protein